MMLFAFDQVNGKYTRKCIGKIKSLMTNISFYFYFRDETLTLAFIEWFMNHFSLCSAHQKNCELEIFPKHLNSFIVSIKL